MLLKPNAKRNNSMETEGSEETYTTFDALMQPLEHPLTQHQQNHAPHHRERLHFVEFVRLLIYYFSKGCETGRQLLTDVQSAAPELQLSEVANSTFFDAFNRFPVEWFAGLLSFLLSAVAWQAIPELDALGKLYCVDGSIFPAISTMLWAEYSSKHQAIRFHLIFELNRMLPVQFMIGNGKSNEKDALRQMLEAGVTYIADRGYYSFALLAEIVQADAFFVFRAKCNLKYVWVERLPVLLPETARHLFRHVTDRRVRLSNAEGQPIYRLVSFSVGKERYLILTNRLDLTTFQVILLYAYRWQVELIFRFLKRSLNGLHLLSHSPEGVTIQFYILLITALLELNLKQCCVSIYETPTSVGAPNADTSRIAGLMIDPHLLAGARGSTFLATIGTKLQRYWKIGKHWLVTFRNLLAHPFNQRVIFALGQP
jgi:hypothetical protein